MADDFSTLSTMSEFIVVVKSFSNSIRSDDLTTTTNSLIVDNVEKSSYFPEQNVTVCVPLQSCQTTGKASYEV